MAVKKRKARIITKQEDIDFLVNIKQEDITLSFTLKMFGEFNGKVRFNPYDEVELPIGCFGLDDHKNTNKIYTTVGLWIFNKFFIEEHFIPLLGYINETINKKVFGKINKKLTYGFLEDDITQKQFDYFMIRTEKMMPICSVICPSLSEEILLSSYKAQKKIKELYNSKYKEAIDNKDGFAASALENEVLDYMKKELDGDPGMDCYDSGARGSFDNNFKNMFVMKGAVKDPETGKFNIIMSNFMDGIKKEEFPAIANSAAAGPYSRARLTALGGYKEKIFVSAFQHVKLDKPGSDCHTARYIEQLLTSDNIADYMYDYVIEGNNLVEITSKNVDKYIGKKVKLRFSSICESKTGYCNKCAGNLFYRLNMLDIGMAMSIIPDTLKLKLMKKFHDSVSRYYEMDPMKAFGIK